MSGIYEIWRAVDGSELTLFCASAQTVRPDKTNLTRDVEGRRMRLLASFWASSWEAAKQARDAIMGW